MANTWLNGHRLLDDHLKLFVVYLFLFQLHQLTSDEVSVGSILTDGFLVGNRITLLLDQQLELFLAESQTVHLVQLALDPLLQYVPERLNGVKLWGVPRLEMQRHV